MLRFHNLSLHIIIIKAGFFFDGVLHASMHIKSGCTGNYSAILDHTHVPPFGFFVDNDKEYVIFLITTVNWTSMGDLLAIIFSPYVDICHRPSYTTE